MAGSEPCHTRPDRFSHSSYRLGRPEVHEGRRACHLCPFAAECLVWALANPTLVPDGIWAATRQRTAIRHKLAARLGTGDRYEHALRTAYAEAAATRKQAAGR
ncbi:WhiB family transcriptional regulator [Streptomyces sp. NPDC090053]|uniref:WhiB family transcriptional regulator n=1 Tax=Streptomyces sp. NPDC090053 TaxID=3365932 RepID=UPI002253EEBD|nr:WhiB family transcriptional regulator [Streptomyces sp. NBC_01500]